MFDAQEREYREQVLGGGKSMVAIEAGVGDNWYKYVGSNGLVIGLTSFGESAPANQLFEHFGLTVDAIINKIAISFAI